MSIAIHRAAPAHKAACKPAKRLPANDAKFSGSDRIAIIFGSSIVLWTAIISVVAHYV